MCWYGLMARRGLADGKVAWGARFFKFSAVNGGSRLSAGEKCASLRFSQNITKLNSGSQKQKKSTKLIKRNTGTLS